MELTKQQPTPTISTAKVAVPKVNLASPEFKANPYPFYAQLRAEAPVYKAILPDKQSGWLVTRYDDVLAVLKDDQHFIKNYRNAMSQEQQRKMPWVPPMFKALEQNLLGVDGDQHTRLRGLVHKAFTPPLVERMRTRVQTIANELLNNAQSKGSMDLIRDYALPIPLTVIAQILGIPAEDVGKFSQWSKSLIALTATGNVLRGIPSLMAMNGYLRRIIKQHRASPQDDLISALVEAEEAGNKLNDEELLAMIFIMLIAGHETTVNLIGSGALALLENADQMVLLRQKPELMTNAIEELLRFVSPVEQATERYPVEDTVVHGVTIPKGEMILAVIASANRDEAQFEHGDTLDITRDAHKHVAFGQGIHYCVGAPLARLEGQIALNILLARGANLRLNVSVQQLPWRAGMTVRGLEALPVTL